MKRIEASLSGSSGSDLASPESKQVDLFSEVHLNELRKLEKQLELLEKEKSALTQNLRENQASVERSQSELQVFVSRLAQLAAHVDSLHRFYQNADKNVQTGQAEKLIACYQQWYKLSGKEIDQLKQDIRDLEKLTACSDSTMQLRTEITNLKNKVSECFLVLFYLFTSIRITIKCNIFI